MAQMLLPYRDNLVLVAQHKINARKDTSANARQKMQIIRASRLDFKVKKQEDVAQGLIERIGERFTKLDLSVSSYDTAWVAMVPSNSTRCFPKEKKQLPCFPSCVEWIMENQKADGSWGLNSSHPSLVKDSLSSTLACVLALQKWNVGEQLIQKGLDFIGSNRLSVADKNQISPLGFDIVFPGMISYAQDLGLNLPLDAAFLALMHHHRDLQIQRVKGGSLAYIAEGFGESYDWKQKIKNEQRSNGSIFNSPSATAAALIHLPDDRCFEYLQSVLKIYGKAVPTIYPYDKYARLCMIDTLERLGIARYFKCETEIVLDETHRCWQQRNEEIFLDPACCALAFRLLKMHGYEVASNALEEYIDQEHFFNTLSPEITNTNKIIELYKASEVTILEEEPILENIKNWTNIFLKRQLSNQEICDDQLQKEVNYALDYSINSLGRLAHKRRIELYDPNRFRMHKTSYRCSNIDNMDILEFSIQDYNKCQAILQEELDQHVRWIKNNRMESLNFEWHMLKVSFFQIAAVYFLPEEADVRALWTHIGVIGTLLDDLFDDDGSTEELLNVLELAEKWDDHSAVGYSSERVEILFSVVQKSVDYFASRGFIAQGRCIKHELIELWDDFIKCMMKEVEWWREKATPSVDEYVINGRATVGVGLYCICFYFLGVEFSKDTMSIPEFQSLYKHGGLFIRLLNDCQGIKETDKVQRKINGCWLLMKDRNGAITEEEAVKEARRIVENSRREVLRMSLLQTEKSVIPWEIRDAFFKMIQIGQYLYGNSTDEYRHPIKNIDDIKAILYEPIAISTKFPKEKN